MTFERFDLVVVPFPFSEREGAKRRPALVVSSTDFNLTHDHVVLAMVTTGARTRWPSDVAISPGAATGLAVPSVVRLKLFTLDRALILRTIGKVSGADAVKLDQALRRNLLNE
ncbi:MAG: type II toxin-antitoxin system PemK/MazF family toxin [Pseudomonadota bacterium]